MENASFIGIFGVATADMLPSGLELSGLCYVWQSQHGKRLVVPLNAQHIPTGACLIMEGGEFRRFMREISQDATPGLSPGASVLRPDSPDLLGIWYEQAVNTPEAAVQPAQDDAAYHMGLTLQPTQAPVSLDEAVFTPAWHPDDMLDPPMRDDDDTGSSLADMGDSFVMFGERHPASYAAMPPSPPTSAAPGVYDAPVDTDPHMIYEPPTQPQFQPAPPAQQHQYQPAPPTQQHQYQPVPPEQLRQYQPVPPEQLHQYQPAPPEQQHPYQQTPPERQQPYQPAPPVSGATVVPGGMDPEAIAEEEEIRAARLEHVMRSKFDILLSKLDDRPDAATPALPGLDEEIIRLLTFGSGFTWKQKFMFTEFGLALRRKHKPELALAGHMRALSLAPQDEHVLFNVARTEYELGRIDRAHYYLDMALSVAPDFEVARNFKLFLAGRT